MGIKLIYIMQFKNKEEKEIILKYYKTDCVYLVIFKLFKFHLYLIFLFI